MQATPAGRWGCRFVPQCFHDNVMALLAITFSGGNDIVLFLLILGLKAQKKPARGRASASPRVNVPHHSRPARAKALLRYLLAECDFSKLSNKICTIDVKIHIFAS